MAGFHTITAAIVGAGFIGPVHVEGLRRLGVRVKGIAGISPEDLSGGARVSGERSLSPRTGRSPSIEDAAHPPPLQC